MLAYPLPAEAPLPWVALDDVADQVARALIGGGRPRQLICGPEPLTGEETADALARALGRPVRWETIELVEYGGLDAPLRRRRDRRRHRGLVHGDERGSALAGPDPALVRIGSTDLESLGARAIVGPPGGAGRDPLSAWRRTHARVRYRQPDRVKT